jgi:hypothetical protein
MKSHISAIIVIIVTAFLTALLVHAVNPTTYTQKTTIVYTEHSDRGEEVVRDTLVEFGVTRFDRRIVVQEIMQDSMQYYRYDQGESIADTIYFEILKF